MCVCVCVCVCVCENGSSIFIGTNRYYTRELSGDVLDPLLMSWQVSYSAVKVDLEKMA